MKMAKYKSFLNDLASIVREELEPGTRPSFSEEYRLKGTTADRRSQISYYSCMEYRGVVYEVSTTYLTSCICPLTATTIRS